MKYDLSKLDPSRIEFTKEDVREAIAQMTSGWWGRGDDDDSGRLVEIERLGSILSNAGIPETKHIKIDPNTLFLGYLASREAAREEREAEREHEKARKKRKLGASG